MAKEHGGIEVTRNGGMRDGAKAWQRGKAIDLSQVTDDMIEGEPFTPERWSEQPNAILFNDETMAKVKSYGEYPAPEKKPKRGRFGTGIGDTGDHDKTIPPFNPDGKIQKQNYNPWGVSQKAAQAHYGREAIQNNRNDINYINAHKEDYPDWRFKIAKANQNIRDIKDRNLSESKLNQLIEESIENVLKELL